MAAPPPRDLNDAPYNDGGGQGYGKFRKQPLRRTTRRTPYDRPPTAVRNPASGNLQRQGWLSKLVDPAQRLITSSAYRLFGSVFRKHLPPPPPLQPLEHPELSLEDTDKQPRESVSADQLGKQVEVAGGCDNPNNSCSTSGVSELELILKQKTFTRSEIDHLTALLLSRMPDGEEEKRPEIIHSRATMPQNGEEFQNTPSRDSGLGRNLLSAPISDSRVLDEHVATPAEVAMAYMGSRPSMGSPSKQGFRNEPLKENSLAVIDQTFTAKSPMTSVLPSSSRSARFPENGFVTPRSRGRTAIYNMARTPYTRVHHSTSPQNAGTSDAFDQLPSSSRNPWENNRFSGSEQGSLKRRISVLDSDMGSIGPIRRIRQKSNLLSSARTLPVRGAGFGPDVSHHSDSVEKPILAGEDKPSRGNGDKIHGSGFNRVSSKSSEVASKILQQLDVLVSSREKSPAKLSPSMLRGPALRSLENIDSSKFLDNLDIKHGNLLSDARDIQPLTVDKMEQNGLIEPIASLDRSASSINGADSTNLVKKDVPSLKATVAPVAETVPQSSLHKKRGFQMSAHEDFVELDDDNNHKGTLSASISYGEKLDNVLAENRTGAFDTVGVEKLPTITESVITGNSSGSAGPVTPPSTITNQQAMADSRSTLFSDKAVLPGKSDTTPVFSFAETVFPEKAQNHVSPISNSSSTFNEAPLLKSSAVAVNDSAGQKSRDLHGPKLDGTSSTPVFTGSSDSVGKETVLEKADDRSNIKASFFDRSPEPATSSIATSSSTTKIFSFGIAAGSTPNNGFVTSIPSLSATNQPLLSNKISQTSSNGSSSTLASSISDPIAISSSADNASSSGSFGALVPAAPFKSISSVVPPTLVSPGGTSSTTTGTGGSIFGVTSAVTSTGITSFTSTSIGSNIIGSGSTSTSTKISTFSTAPSAVTSSGFCAVDPMSSAMANAGSNGSAAISSPGVISGDSAVTSAPSTTFGFSTGVAVSTATNQSQGFNPFGAGGALNGFATSTQSMPLQSSASASSPSVLAGNKAISFGSSVSSSSTSVATMFSSGAAFGLNSSSSQSNSSSSSSSMTTSIFGSNWQGLKPLSGPALSSSSSSVSPVFSFGAPSTASSAATSTSAVFGSTINSSPFSSMNSTSSASLFPFSSPATNTQTQPLFGKPNPSFAFGSSPSSNGDQMTMEDSMAEDPVQAASPPGPVFGQQPTPGFMFGSTAPPAGNQFGSTTPPGPSMFQFAGPSNPATPQNTSLFQGSGSFTGGGSFSLGAGGDDKSQRRIIKPKRHLRKTSHRTPQ